MWRVGCDGKVYEREARSNEFKLMRNNLPKGIKAKELLYLNKKVAGGYEDVIYVIGSDNVLYASSWAGGSDRGFEPSAAQLPPTATCESPSYTKKKKDSSKATP